MKPALGWTMLSREEMRQVERSLANSEQETRDEIGFLLIHQVSPVTSKPASRGRIKTGHSEVIYSYQGY